MNNIEDLKQQYKQTRRILWVYPFIIVAAGILIFVNRYASLAVLFAAVLVQIFVFRPMQKKYQNNVVNANVQSTVCAQLDDAEYIPATGGGITESTVKAAALLPFDTEKGACLLKMGVSGKSKTSGKSVSLCDATLMEHFILVKKGKTRRHFTIGCMLRVELESDTGLDWQIIDKDLLPTPVRLEYYTSRNEVAAADYKIDERFCVYKAFESPALPDGFAKQLQLLCDYTPGKVGVSIRGNVLTVFLRDRLIARPVSMPNAPTQEMLDFDPMPELAYVLRMANIIK